MNPSDRESEAPPTPAPDLQTQLESLFHQVWECEAGWHFEQRLQLALAAIRGGDEPGS